MEKDRRESLPNKADSGFRDLDISQDPSLSAYSTEQFTSELSDALELPNTIDRGSALWVSLEGIPMLISTSLFSRKPAPDETPRESRQIRESSDPDDVIRISMYLPDHTEIEEIATLGYTDRARGMLHLPDSAVEELGLEAGRDRVVELHLQGDTLFRTGRTLEYTITRDELPGSVAAMAAFVKAKAIELGAQDIQLNKKDAQLLMLGGLTGSAVANLTDRLPGEAASNPDIQWALRPEFVKVNNVELPLSGPDRNLLYDESAMARISSEPLIPALAVILREGVESSDYSRATKVVTDRLQHYYHSPQSSANREQFDLFRKIAKIREQEQLGKDFASTNGYDMGNFVGLPPEVPKPTFEKNFELPDPTALQASSTQMHYNTIESHTITDPITGEQKSMPWFQDRRPYRYGEEVDKIVADALEHGYLRVPLEWKEDPAAEELLNLWETLGSRIDTTPIDLEIYGTLMIGKENTPFGRKMFFQWDDESAGHEISPRQEKLREDLKAAYAEMPEEALALIDSGKGEGLDRYAYTHMASLGNLYIMEQYPKPLELMLEYLKERVDPHFDSKYDMGKFVDLPPEVPQPTFEKNFELPDPSALQASSTQTHYNIIESQTTTDPITVQESRPYRHGEAVDKIIADALEHGYLRIPLEWKEDPAAVELLNLWELLGDRIEATPINLEIFGTLMIGKENTPFGRKMFFQWNDESAGHETSPRSQKLREDLEAAYAAMPEAARALIDSGNGRGMDRHADTQLPSMGNLYIMEQYPEPLELVLEYLKERADSHFNSK